MTKLVLFDGNAIMHRAYHALPPMTALEGYPINAVYGLVSMLLKVISDLKPTHIAFAFDRPEPTFRKKILEDYQGHRPEMENDLSSQFKVAQEVIKTLGIPVYDKKGFEADDVIGTLAYQLTQKSNVKNQNDNSKFKLDEAVIVTGDRDMLQLVDDKVRLYMPVKGLGEAKLYRKNETIERMGVGPDKIIDYKALVGDPSDNYKGVPGIGPKTAIKLLDQFGDLDGIYKNLDKLSDKSKTLLQKNKDSAYVSYKLATIVRDVDINANLNEMKKWQLDSKKVIDLFEEIGFKTLTKRVKEIGKQIQGEKQMSLI